MADNALGRGLDALIKKPSKPKKAEKKKLRIKNLKLKQILHFRYLMIK